MIFDFWNPFIRAPFVKSNLTDNLVFHPHLSLNLQFLLYYQNPLPTCHSLDLVIKLGNGILEYYPSSWLFSKPRRFGDRILKTEIESSLRKDEVLKKSGRWKIQESHYFNKTPSSWTLNEKIQIKHSNELDHLGTTSANRPRVWGDNNTTTVMLLCCNKNTGSPTLADELFF